MATLAHTQAPEPPRSLDLGRRRFSADELFRMMQADILHDDDHVELVGGEILQVTPQGPDHRALKDELHGRLADAYRGREVHVLDQGPLRAGSYGVPEPDLAVVRGRPRDYLERHPQGADALLVIEIAKTSQERDRAKATDYARGAVPTYWLVDILARTLAVYSEPDPEGGVYRRVQSLGEGEDVILPELGLPWRVASLLP